MHYNSWMKRVLVPLWAVRLILSIILAVTSAIGLYTVIQWTNEHAPEEKAFVTAGLGGAAAVVLAWAGVTIISDITEIILFARGRFGPVAAVVLSSIKTALWLIMSASAIAGAAQSHDHNGLVVFFVLMIVLTTIGQLSYVSVILHRHRKGGLQNWGTYEPTRVEVATASGTQAPYDLRSPLNPFIDPSREPSWSSSHRKGLVSRYYDSDAQHGPAFEMQPHHYV